MLLTTLKSFPALRAILKILRGLIPTLAAPFVEISSSRVLYPAQMPGEDLHCLTMGDSFSYLRVQFVDRIAAARLHKITFIRNHIPNFLSFLSVSMIQYFYYAKKHFIFIQIRKDIL